MGLNLAVLLDEAAREHGDRIGVVCAPERVTWRDLRARAGRFAAALVARGVRPGDRVAMALPNVTAFPIAYYGTLVAGAVAVPFHPLYKRDEMAFLLRDSGARVLVGFAPLRAEPEAAARDAGGRDVIWSAAGGPDALEALAGAAGTPVATHPAGADADAVLIYTSGTTGKPKGVRLTHSNLLLNAWVSRDLAALTAEDVLLGVLPFFHSFGQTCVLNAAVAAAARLVCLPRFDTATAFAALHGERVTVLAGVPTLFHALDQAPEAESFDASRLRLCISGGAAMPEALLRRFESRFRTTILEGYGLTETSPAVAFNRRDRPRRVGTIGFPVWGVEVRIVRPDGREAGPGEDGELWVRGHGVMAGYWQRPEETAATLVDGWLRTGDLGRRDADGYLVIVDRLKEIIIRGGYNISPREVEEVLATHPAVGEAAVFGVPDAAEGEEIVAVVSLRAGARATPDEIQDFAKARMSPTKYPRRVVIRDSLPKGPTGKVQKRELLDALAGGGA